MREGRLDINQTTSTPEKSAYGKGKKVKGVGGRMQHHMATGARGQGAIQSNEIALGKEKKDDGGGRNRQRWERVVGNITSFCVYLCRTGRI